MSSEYRTGRQGETFTYRGHTLEELQEMELDEVVELLPARVRRRGPRGRPRGDRRLPHPDAPP